jgi:hypothetical protein
MPLTLLDVAKAHSSRAESALIESVATYAPELNAFPSEVITDTEFDTLDRTQLPVTAFTNANEGVAPGSSKYKVRKHQCHIFRGAVLADKAVADAFNLKRGAGRFQQIESEGVGRSALIELGSQIYYGTDVDAKGFPGLRAIWDAHTAALVAANQPGNAVGVDATGSSAGAATSLYAVKFGDQFCKVIFGGSKVLKLPPFREQSVTDANGGQYDAYVSNMVSWVGLQCANPYSVGRIYNLTTQAGKGLTDSLIADLLGKFPVGFTPDALFMSRQSRTQLQKSRTVVLQGNGKAGSIGSDSGLVAPMPTEAFGIPIITTDSIVNTEAIV